LLRVFRRPSASSISFATTSQLFASRLLPAFRFLYFLRNYFSTIRFVSSIGPPLPLFSSQLFFNHSLRIFHRPAASSISSATTIQLFTLRLLPAFRFFHFLRNYFSTIRFASSTDPSLPLFSSQLFLNHSLRSSYRPATSSIPFATISQPFASHLPPARRFLYFLRNCFSTIRFASFIGLPLPLFPLQILPNYSLRIFHRPAASSISFATISQPFASHLPGARRFLYFIRNYFSTIRFASSTDLPLLLFPLQLFLNHSLRIFYRPAASSIPFATTSQLFASRLPQTLRFLYFIRNYFSPIRFASSTGPPLPLFPS
jgi:hypothetical protein